MTTESSPGQGAPQEDLDWAFRPRTPATGPRPPHREEQRAYGDEHRTQREEHRAHGDEHPSHGDGRPAYRQEERTYQDEQPTYRQQSRPAFRDDRPTYRAPQQPTRREDPAAYRQEQQEQQARRNDQRTYRQQQPQRDDRQAYRQEQPTQHDEQRAHRQDQRAYRDDRRTYQDEQRARQDERRTAAAGQWDDGWPAQPHGGSAGTRWDQTMPIRTPEPRTGAHESLDEQDRRTPPRTPHGGEPAHHEPRHPQPSAGAGEPPRKRRWVGRMALTLVVLAGAGGAAAVLFEQEDAAAVASKQLTRQWQIPAPAADDALIGSWLTDKLLVRASSQGGLRAYDLTDGKQVWSTKPSASTKRSAAAGSNGSAGSAGSAGSNPSAGSAGSAGSTDSSTATGTSASAASAGTAAPRGDVPCAMSPTLNAKGIGTVAFGKDGSTCTLLAGVDAATGKILWSMPLTSAKHPAAATASTYVQGNVATIVSENFLGGVDVRTGDRVWGYKARGHYCNAYDWGADGTVLVDDFCLDQKSRFTLTAYDGRTGKVIWRKAESAHSDVTHILSGSPLIASVHTARQDAVRVLGRSGSGRKLAVGNDELTTGNGTGADHSARLYGKVLVTPATAAGNTLIDAFDTTTGAKLWTARSAALAVPASGAHDKVYAVTLSGSPQLISIDPRTGRTTPVAGLPVGGGKWNFTSGTVYVTPDGGVLELNALGSNGGVRLYR